MIHAVRGFKDVYGSEAALWQKAESILRQSLLYWGFAEIRVPVLEYTELFQRGIGDTTDIVEKEMYTFADKGGEKITLRPEGTASVIRFFNEHKLYGTEKFFKFFYIGPMFRYERPQKGRLRQFHQAGIEILGDRSPLAEGEALTLICKILDDFQIRDYTLFINSLGCAACRAEYRRILTAYFEKKEHILCEDCVRRKTTNPMRLLDCKSEQCRENLTDAPRITDMLCADCSAHHRALKELLELYAIPYTEDPFIVRGLDYYNRTVFEVHAKGLGAQSAVLAGGRYDSLSADLGGTDIPAVGWAVGLERLISLLPGNFCDEDKTDVFVIFSGNGAEKHALPLVRLLRKEGIKAEYDIFGGSFKSQFRRADKLRSKKVVIIGENEIQEGVYTIKDMSSGEQTKAPAGTILESIRKEL